MPFPITIGLAVFVVAVLASKVALPYTVFPAGLSAFAGMMEVIGWFVFIIAAAANQSTEYPLGTTGMGIVLAAYFVNLGLNILNYYFLKKYIWGDEKF